ncbi:MAG: ABC transporter permease subunit [Thermomicrobiales bacterium]
MEANPEANASTGQPQPYGEIFDRGYQHYSGERLGRSFAIRRLIIYSIKRGLGIKKRWTSKILPIILYGLAYIPAFIIVALFAFLPASDLEGFGFDSLYGVIEIVILIYASALAPEMLCDDRRERTLQLYFSRPLTRLDYLASKVTAMGLLMSTIIFGPPLLLFLGLTFSDDSPISYFANHLTDLLKITSYGLLVSAFFGALSLSIATFTTRKGVAAAIFIIGALMLQGIARSFYEAIGEGSLRGYLVFISPPDFIDSLRRWLFRTDSQNDLFAATDLPGVVTLIWLVVVIGVAMFLMHRTYLQED